HRGAGLARRPGFAPALGNHRAGDAVPAAGAGGQQGPVLSRGPARGRRGIADAAVDLAAARARAAQPPAVPHGARACAAGDPAWRVHGGLFDRRADHRRVRLGQERAGAGTDQPRPPAGRRRCARVHPDRTGRARRHLPGTAAGPAGAAWTGRAQHPPDVRRYRCQAEQVPAADRAPGAPGRGTAAARGWHGAPHRRPRPAPRARPGRADDHPAGDAGTQPCGADRSGNAHAYPARERHRPGGCLPGATFAFPGKRRGAGAAMSTPAQPPRHEDAASRMPAALLVVTGMSGGGKSVALKTLEDLGFYCVDNLPAELLPEFVRAASHPERAEQKLAVGIDMRNRGDLGNLPEWLSAVGAMGLEPQLVFFDAAEPALLRRYADTRRRHPLTHLGLALADAISLERQALKPLRALADVVVD